MPGSAVPVLNATVEDEFKVLQCNGSTSKEIKTGIEDVVVRKIGELQIEEAVIVSFINIEFKCGAGID